MEDNEKVSGSTVLMWGIIILCFGILLIAISEYSGFSLFMGIMACLFGTIGSLIGIARIVSWDKKDEELRLERNNKKALEEKLKQKQDEELLNNYNFNRRKYEEKYGAITTEIRIRDYGSPYYIEKYILIYEGSSHIIIKDSVYRFEDIIGYELTDNQQTIYKESISTSTAKTSTGNMLGRAVVGGVLLGGAGAVIGGATANKNIETVHSAREAQVLHDYILYVSVNNLNNPLIEIKFGNKQQQVMKIAAILNVILERNKSNIIKQ